MADMTADIDRLGVAFAAVIGQGYVVQTVNLGGVIEWMCFDQTGGSVYNGRIFALAEFMQPVEQQLRAAGGGAAGGSLVTQARLVSANRFEFRHGFELAGLSPARVVVDQGYRYPGHAPQPATAQQVPLQQRATDAAVLSTIQTLIDEYMSRYTAVAGQAPPLGEGCSEAELAQAETRIGVRLPDDLRAVYRTIHADPDVGLLGRFCVLPLERAAPAQTAHDDLFEGSPVVLEAVPAKHIRRMSRNDLWITFAADYEGNYCAVDMDPAELGTVGQLILHGRDHPDATAYLSSSLTAQLTSVVESLQSGGWTADPHSPRLRPPQSFAQPRPRSPTWSIRVGSDNLADLIDGLENPGTVQQAFLNDATAVDLSALAPLTNLKRLSINRAAAVTGQLPAHLPIESLSIHTNTLADTVLTTHPALWDLTIRAATPITIQTLQQLPKLAKLNLSEADTTDMADNLATLKNLRVLTLTAQQWQQIRERATTLPALAAAEMTGHTPLDTALEWAQWIRHQTAKPPRRDTHP